MTILQNWINKCNYKIVTFFLLVDKMPVYVINKTTNLTNVAIHFLPPNTTAYLQSYNAGIINFFKVSNIF
jgi:hypothetical protein